MEKLIRFGVSMDEGLLKQFDRYLTRKKYTNRSEAIRDLVREQMVKSEWEGGESIAGAITVVYDHHQRELVNRMLDIQHDYHDLIISTQHVHLDHDNCLEITAVQGNADEVRELADALKALKGVKHQAISMTTTGKRI